ncbi:YbgA family protein [Bacillus sp. DJP31]|uniref:YbgA family protein n=1 Tax=Bacillus sp. DJP31 TaxID=3409789 RepID=UPI003BB531F0
MYRENKPKIVVSKCLEFEECRYNGDVIHDPVVKRLQSFVEFIPVCPEVSLGLGIPRETIRIVENDGQKKLVQPSTGRDFTDRMTEFTSAFLSTIEGVDGFILKSKSPTCGMKDVKVYSGLQQAPVIGKTSGIFGGAIVEQYPFLAIEEEARLSNFSIREHFFTKLFTYAFFRSLKEQQHTIQSLITFHSQNKYLFMAYNQTTQKELGRIVASYKQQSIEEIYSLYESQLQRLFARKPRDQAHINVCEHIMGYFKKDLTQKEKAYFTSILEKYRDEKIPLSSVTSILKSWVIRFDNEYLFTQTYFEPYPDELIEISDSGKGRSYN